MANPLKLRPAITFHPVAVAGCSQQGSFLAFADTRLVAILVFRDGVRHGASGWFLEIGFGPCAEGPYGAFGSAEEAQRWVRTACWNASA
jgi:hypothetical protein